MTSFVINSGSTEYFDQKTGGSVNAALDTYTISNGTNFVIRTDTYACPNHSTAFGSLDNVAYSGIGGDVTIDPTYTRHVAFTGGSGNSPAFGAAISQGGVSGVFLGVWADWQSEPIVPGAAIPATGFIKIGGITGGAFSAGALTGITATCSGADVQSWIEVRGADTATLAPNRLGSVKSTLAWFYLGVTSGSAGQVVSCPTTGNIAALFPGCFIESSPGSDVYERYIGAGSAPALSTVSTDKRCQWVWQTTSGLRIGNDGTNNVGYVPPAGCKIRVPAIFLTCCTRTASGSGARVTPNSTFATRQEFVTTASGSVDLDGIVCYWRANFVNPYICKIKNSIIASVLNITNNAVPFQISNSIVGVSAAQTADYALALTANLFGGTINDCDFARYQISSGTTQAIGVTNAIGLTISDVKITSVLRRAVLANSLAFFFQFKQFQHYQHVIGWRWNSI